MPRKRKPGPRTKSGRLSRAYKRALRDSGTPEGIAKRQALVGAEGDPVLASTAIGTLYAHGYVDREQYDAGLEYRWLYSTVYGMPWPRAALLDDQPAGKGLTESAQRRVERRFMSKTAHLTPEQRRVATDVCVLDHRPVWFFCDRLGLKRTPIDDAEQLALLSALDLMLSRGPKGRQHLTVPAAVP